MLDLENWIYKVNDMMKDNSFCQRLGKDLTTNHTKISFSFIQNFKWQDCISLKAQKLTSEEVRMLIDIAKNCKIWAYQE